MAYAAALRDYLATLPPTPQPLTDDQERATYPGHSTIHRTVEYTFLDNEQSARSRLGQARGIIEYDLREDTDNDVMVEMDGKGVSCHATCVYAPRVRTGFILLSQLTEMLGGKMSRGRTSVQIAGTGYPLVGCYRRELEAMTTHDYTVGDALRAKGKDEKCCLDPGSLFTYYWDTAEHGLITLREPMHRQQDHTILFDIVADVLHFYDPPFEVTKWTWCGEASLAVKLPSKLVKVVEEGGSDIAAAIRKLKGGQKAVLKKLLSIFIGAPVGGALCDAVDKLIWLVFEVALEDLPPLFGKRFSPPSQTQGLPSSRVKKMGKTVIR